MHCERYHYLSGRFLWPSALIKTVEECKKIKCGENKKIKKTFHPHSFFLKLRGRWWRENEFLPAQKLKENSKWSSVSFCCFRQVKSNISGFNDDSRAETCRSPLLWKKREVFQSHDLVLYFEVNEKEQGLSLQFFPTRCVCLSYKHTNVLTCSLWSVQMLCLP